MRVRVLVLARALKVIGFVRPLYLTWQNLEAIDLVHDPQLRRKGSAEKRLSGKVYKKESERQTREKEEVKKKQMEEKVGEVTRRCRCRKLNLRDET